MRAAATLAAMEAAPITRNTSSFREGRAAAFLVMDAVYLLAVFGWTIFFPPLGRDWMSLANFAPFGDRVLFYHVTNLVLLYLLMALIFFLTRLATGGPWWLGSVAAVLFMAHPLKAESALNLCGMGDLLPAMLSLSALLAYAAARQTPRRTVLSGAFLLYACALLLVPGQGGLPVAIAAWEAFVIPRERRRWRPLTPFLIAAALGWFVYTPVLASAPLAQTGAVWPLVYLLYPIGLLPETASAFRAQPLLPALVLALLALGTLWLARRVRHPAFSFGLVAAVAFAVLGENRPVDAVHLVGGGRMLCAIALFSVALAGFFHRIQHHRAWPKPVVWVTSMLCLVLMILHVQTNLGWARAGRMVEKFRQAAITAAAQHPGARLAVFPDWRHSDRAPVCLAESVRHSTPFGRALPVEVIASYDPDTFDQGALSVVAYGPTRASFAATVQGPLHVTGPQGRRITPDQPLSWNWRLWLAPRDWTTPKHTVQVNIVPDGEPFPELRICCP